MTLPAPSGPFGPNRGTDTGLWRTGELEDELIATLDLPLNLQGNPLNQFHPVLAGMRAECVAQAKALPVVPNPGIGGGRQARTPARPPDDGGDSDSLQVFGVWWNVA